MQKFKLGFNTPSLIFVKLVRLVKLSKTREPPWLTGGFVCTYHPVVRTLNPNATPFTVKFCTILC